MKMSVSIFFHSNWNGHKLRTNYFVSHLFVHLWLNVNWYSQCICLVVSMYGYVFYLNVFDAKCVSNIKSMQLMVDHDKDHDIDCVNIWKWIKLSHLWHSMSANVRIALLLNLRTWATKSVAIILFVKITTLSSYKVRRTKPNLHSHIMHLTITQHTHTQTWLLGKDAHNQFIRPSHTLTHTHTYTVNVQKLISNIVDGSDLRLSIVFVR